ncbi:MAG: galactosyltransferase-related protein [Gammaproteobacteria bacterium]|nr:galactosyltransferase-related protein [Gammaproteobacteria bacterium]
MNASYLITFRDDDGARLPLLEAVTAWLAEIPSLEVIVVEQGAAPRLTPGHLGAHVRILHVFNDGPFNKSWGLNVAARNASHELLVTGDADMIMAGEALSRALTVCRDHYDAVNPYSNLVDLTKPQTEAILRGETDLAAVQPPPGRDRLSQGEHLCFCGGICVFRREVYFALGGMDERFLGWGGEDDAMSANLERYTDRIAVQRDTPAYHLWHPRPPQRYRQPHYRRNLELANHYRACDADTLDRRRAEQRASMGDPKRYAT